MSELDVEAPRCASPAGCASDLVLDRYRSGELSTAEKRAVDEHLLVCARCSSQLRAIETFEQSARAWLPENIGELLKASESPPAKSRARGVTSRVSWATAVASVVAIAASVSFWLRPAANVGEGAREATASSAVRIKGGTRLTFFVKRGDAVLRGGPDEIVYPGDIVNFVSVSAESSFVAVLSKDGAGHASVYFPAGTRAQELGAGEQQLPQAIALDNVLGRESVYGVFCPTEFDVEGLRRGLSERGELVPPPGCVVDTLRFEKRQSP